MGIFLMFQRLQEEEQLLQPEAEQEAERLGKGMLGVAINVSSITSTVIFPHLFSNSVLIQKV